jgi:hypothetical protein
VHGETALCLTGGWQMSVSERDTPCALWQKICFFCNFAACFLPRPVAAQTGELGNNSKREDSDQRKKNSSSLLLVTRSRV